MKKQNVNSKLSFDKSTLVELNDQELNVIHGGTATTGEVSIAISVAAVTIAYEVGKEVGHWISKAF